MSELGGGWELWLRRFHDEEGWPVDELRRPYLSEIIMSIPRATYIEGVAELTRRFGTRSFVVVPVAGPIDASSGDED